MKRHLALLLLVVVTAFGLIPAAARGEGSSTSDFVYEEANGAATITGYSGPGGDIAIPSEIDGCLVTGIRDQVFLNAGAYFTKVFIPASLLRMEGNPFMGASNGGTFEVDPANPLYKVINDALVDRVNHVLIMYGPADTRRIYAVPDGIARVEKGAFQDFIRLQAVVIPDSVNEIAEGAFAGFPSGLKPVLVGREGGLAQRYAVGNQFPFCAVDAFMAGLDQAELDELTREANSLDAADDPFAVFDTVGEAGLRENEDFADLAALLNDGLWLNGASTSSPAFLRANPSLTGEYRDAALDAGKVLTTKASFDMPSSQLGSPAVSDFLANSYLRCDETRTGGRDAATLAMGTYGREEAIVSGTAQDDALYLYLPYPNGGLLALTRAELARLIQKGLQAINRQHSLFTVRMLMERLRQESVYLKALTGKDSQTTAFFDRLARRMTEETPEQNEAHDEAARRETLRFTQEDLEAFLALPQMCYAIPWIHNLQAISAVDDIDSLLDYVVIDDRYDSIRRDLDPIVTDGELSVQYDEDGEIVSLELNATADTTAVKNAGVDAIHLACAMYRKTTAEGAAYALTASLTADLPGGPKNFQGPILEGSWIETGRLAVEGRLRLKRWDEGRGAYAIDGGLQYKKTIDGDVHKGTETGQLNGYWTEYGDTTRVSLTSKAGVGDSGIDRSVRLFVDDLNNPLATVKLSTGVGEDGFVYYEMMNPKDGGAAHPATWSDGEVARYFTGQLEGVRALVNDLADAMPGDIADMFRRAIFGAIGYPY